MNKYIKKYNDAANNYQRYNVSTVFAMFTMHSCWCALSRDRHLFHSKNVCPPPLPYGGGIYFLNETSACARYTWNYSFDVFFFYIEIVKFFFKQSILKSFRIIISNLNYQFVDPRPVTAYWWRHRFLNPWSIVTTRPFSLPCKYYLFAGSYLQCRENGRVATIESLVC